MEQKWMAKGNFNWRLTKLLVSMLLAQALYAAETVQKNAVGALKGAVVQPTNGTVRALGNARLSLVQEAKGYNSWSMVRTLGDKIVCTYGRGLGHSVEGSRGAYARTSLDGGVTWSSEICITNDPVVCEGVEGVGNGDDGAMLCWMNCRLRRKGHILHDLYRTEDGVSYEKIASPDLSPEPIQITGIFSVPGVGLMSLWFSGNYRRDEPGNAWGTLVSRDGGRTWVQRTVESGLAKTEWPTEASAVHLGGGRILAIGRSEGVLKRQFQLTSLDGGLTWRKAGTNIRDVKESTPSLIYDPATGLVANYYYHRGAKKLKRRVVRADSVFDNPESWPPPEVLAEGNEARFYDAGNVNAVEWRGRHLATFYSGTESDCAVYEVSTPAFMEGRGFTKDAFENPAAIRFPGLFWKWDGKLTADRLEREMDDMEAHGLLTPCIHPYPKAFWPGGVAKENWQDPDYMTPGHLDLLEKMVRRGAKRGQRFWLYDEGGWPSGSANGEVMKTNPKTFALRIVRMGKDGKAHIETVPQNPNWAAPYPSLIERGVTEKFIELTHERWKERLGDEFGKSIRFAFTDEPQMPSRKENQLPWCTDFAERFREAKGYDILPYLDDLAAWSNRNDRIAEVRIDFWDVASTLFAQRYLGTLRKWCRANGLLSGGHLDNEHDPGIYRNHGHTLRALRQFDVPGVDVIFRQLFPDSAQTRTPFPKYASSVANQAGGRYVLSESFAIYGPSTTPDEIRWLVDYQLVRGVNLFVLSSYSPRAIGQAMNGTAGLFGPTNPQWDCMEPFMRRIARCCEMLSRGDPVVETAVFYDARGVWVGGAEEKATLDRHYGVSAALLSRQSDFDFIDDDQIAAAPEPSDGKLRIGKMTYSTVVLPTSQRMVPAAKDKLARFASAGGRLIKGDDFSAVPRTLPVTLADGRPAADIRVMKRFDGARTLYFVVNESRRPASVRLAFAEAGTVVCADPETCRFNAVARAADGTVAWSFRGCDSAIFVVGAEPDEPEAVCGGEAAEIADGWAMAPLRKWEIGEREFKVAETPDAVWTPVQLGDWRKTLGETFCGEVRYRAVFAAARAGVAEFDFGKVCGCCELAVNGTPIGKRFTGPYRWRVNLRQGDNEIVLTVASTLVNLVKDERQRDEIYRNFPPVSFFEKFYRRFNRMGHESGLFGPVLIRPVSQ